MGKPTATCYTKIAALVVVRVEINFHTYLSDYKTIGMCKGDSRKSGDKTKGDLRTGCSSFPVMTQVDQYKLKALHNQAQSLHKSLADH